jgi:hypothetical protein
MPGLEQTISQAYMETDPLRGELLDSGIAEYFENLTSSRLPSHDDLNVAEKKVRSIVKSKMLTNVWLSAISGRSFPDESSRAAIALSFNSLLKPLEIPKPAEFMELKAVSVAFTALVGAVVGMALIIPLARLVFGMRDVGLLLGGPLGAFCMVLIIWRVSKSRFLLRALQGSLGAASVAEIWLALRGYGALPRVWTMLRGKGITKGLAGALKRVLLYVVVIFFLTFAKRQPTYNRTLHEKNVRTSIDQWLNSAISLLASLCYYQSEIHMGPTDKEQVLRMLGRHIYALHRASRQNLFVVADELIQEARNCGFENLEEIPTFLANGRHQQDVLVWVRNLKDKYEIFGDINEGDKVKIERKPVILDGRVVERGLVRKVRVRN